MAELGRRDLTVQAPAKACPKMLDAWIDKLVGGAWPRLGKNKRRRRTRLGHCRRHIT
jgi:hypothetical protein